MATDWKVLPQRQVSNLNAAGEFEDFMEVPFEVIPSGERGTIVVPLRQYSADYVQQLISDRVATIKAVGAL